MQRLSGAFLVGLTALVAGCGQGAVSEEWQSGATVYRITTSGTKVTGKFEVVSPAGQALGFQQGDISFEGARKGNFISGEQVIRYPRDNPCFKPDGRRVPVIGIVGRDGRTMVLDWYNMTVNTQTCEDIGRTVETTLLQRRASGP
jgi:hypothetical protein